MARGELCAAKSRRLAYRGRAWKLTAAWSTRSAFVRGCVKKGHPAKFEEFALFTQADQRRIASQTNPTTPPTAPKLSE